MAIAPGTFLYNASPLCVWLPCRVNGESGSPAFHGREQGGANSCRGRHHGGPVFVGCGMTQARGPGCWRAYEGWFGQLPPRVPPRALVRTRRTGVYPAIKPLRVSVRSVQGAFKQNRQYEADSRKRISGMSPRTAVFASAVIVVLPFLAAPVQAHDYWDRHARDHARHREFHRSGAEAHDRAHREGFYNHREHRAYHRALRDLHGEFHHRHPDTWHDHRHVGQRSYYRHW